MKLWIVRHAMPLIASGVCYGSTDLAAATHQTLLAASALAQTLPSQCNVLGSPLQRCIQLTQALSVLRPDLKLQNESRLREMDRRASIWAVVVCEYMSQ